MKRFVILYSYTLSDIQQKPTTLRLLDYSFAHFAHFLGSVTSTPIDLAVPNTDFVRLIRLTFPNPLSLALTFAISYACFRLMRPAVACPGLCEHVFTPAARATKYDMSLINI